MIRAHCSSGTCGECLACLQRKPMLAPLSLTPLSELRLAELATLAKRRSAPTPGPGSYSPSLPPAHEGGHHRPHRISDGPRPLAPGESSTREREMATGGEQLVWQGSLDSGPGPSGRGLECKDALLRRPQSVQVCVKGGLVWGALRKWNLLWGNGQL